jgi:hypothetical protein
MISKRICAVVIIMAFGMSMAFADERRSYQFDASKISTIKVDLSVGSIVVEHTNVESIDIDMTLSEEGNGWFRRSADLSKMDLDSDVRGSELTIGFDERGAKAELHIRLPTTSELHIHLGVGTVELLHAQSDLIEVNLGVGTIEIDMLDNLAGDIQLSAGVGETTIEGGNNIKTSRAFVSSDLNARGNGATRVHGSVGVGSASISLL